MLSSLSGKIIFTDKESVTIKSGDFGFSVKSPNLELYSKDQQVTLVTHLHWNQEKGPTLFGFSSQIEKAIFLLIIGCSGMGPKIGLAILNQITPSEFLAAIQTGNSEALSAINGIGAKKADQMILQLKNKIGKLVDEASPQDINSTQLTEWKNVTKALKSLNYSKPEIERTLTFLRKECAGKNLSFDQLIRQSLSFLAKKV